jgi:hypothetical protein
MARKGNPISVRGVINFMFWIAIFAMLSTPSTDFINNLLSLMEGVPLDGVGGEKGKSILESGDGVAGGKDEAGPSRPRIPTRGLNDDPAQKLASLRERLFPRPPQIPDLNQDPEDEERGNQRPPLIPDLNQDPEDEERRNQRPPLIPDLNQDPEDEERRNQRLRRISSLFDEYEAELKATSEEIDKLCESFLVRKRLHQFYVYFKNLPQYFKDRERRK